MHFELKLTKPGDQAPKLELNLTKGRFSIELNWLSEHDLDAHALLAVNNGHGAKITALEHILSTYNYSGTNPDGVLMGNPDGSFSTPEGALTHSGDALTGDNQDDTPDEVITVDITKIPKQINEIPIFVTIHPAGKHKFSTVLQAGIRIKDGQGRILGEYQLSNEFGPFDAVQMGTLMRDDNGKSWSYIAAGVGFNGDFNQILEHFS